MQCRKIREMKMVALKVLTNSTCIKIRHVHKLTKKNRYAFEPQHDKTNKMVCAASEDSDQPGHLPSLIRVFTVCSMGRLGP